MVHPNMSLLYFTFRLLASKKENCYVDVIHVAILERELHIRVHDSIILDAMFLLLVLNCFVKDSVFVLHV